MARLGPTVVYGGLQVTGQILGNASSADKWSSPMQLALSGDASGSVTFDGSLGVALDVDVDKFGSFLQNKTSSNLDTIGDIGGFSVRYGTSDATGKPTGTDHAVLTQSFSASWQTQLASDWRTNEWYVRTQENGTWKDWKQLLHTGNWSSIIDSRYVNVTGDSMSGHLTFSSGSGIRKDSSYYLNFNNTDIRMSSVGDIIIDADSNDNESSRRLELRAGLNNLKISGGAANNSNGMLYNGYTVLHSNNYAATLDSRYYTETEADSRFINITGDTMTGALTMGDNDIRFSSDAEIYRSGTDIGSLVPGSDNFLYIRGPSNGHVTVALAANDSNDSFNIISATGSATADHVINKRVFAVLGHSGNTYASGKMYVDSNVTSQTGSRVFADNYHPNADKWTTARTLTLTGDVTGSVSWDGSGNATLNTTSQTEDSTFSVTKGFQPDSTWTDTGIKYSDFPGNGTYIVQIYANNSAFGFYACYWSGIMAVHTTGKNDSWQSEVILNFHGHATSGDRNVYMRNVMTSGNDANLGPQIMITGATSTSTVNLEFKFRKLI